MSKIILNYTIVYMTKDIIADYMRYPLSETTAIVKAICPLSGIAKKTLTFDRIIFFKIFESTIIFQKMY